MKKLIAIFFIAITSRCLATDLVPFTLGPLVSMTSTTLNSKPDFKDQVAGAGYNFGAFVRLKLFVAYAQGELSFGSKSTSATLSSNGVNSNVTYQLKGIDLSAILGLKLFKIRDIGNFRIFGGYNWNNYSDISYSVDGNSFSASNVNPNNHSVLGGIGVDILKFAFDVKYIYGFVDLTDSGTSDVESRVVSVTLAYKIK